LARGGKEQRLTLPHRYVKSGQGIKRGDTISIFNLYNAGLDKYFDIDYNGSQAVKELRKAPKTVCVIIISGNEDIITEKWSLCECLSDKNDYDKPDCGKDRFDTHRENFKVQEIIVLQVLRFLRNDIKKMEEFLNILMAGNPAKYVFLVLYLNINDKALAHTSPTLGLARFLNKINEIFGEKLLGYEVNTVRNPRLDKTRGRLISKLQEV
jgi:hypothetical protein